VLFRSLEGVALDRTDVVVSSHACGNLTDQVIERACSARAAVAVLPCCHDMLRAPATATLSDAGDFRTLEGWVDRALAIDIVRVRWLEQQGYRVRALAIPGAITPKNRLLIGVPRQSTAGGAAADC